MSDVYEPYTKLIRLIVLGKTFEVPENNVILRQLQFVCPDIGFGKYCWNGECHYCEITYDKDGTSYPALACRLPGREGMELTKIAPEMKYNLSEALQAAAKHEKK